MLKVLDANRNQVAIIGDLFNFQIIRELETGDKQLSFNIPSNHIYANTLQEEGYLVNKTDEFVIKEITKDNEFYNVKAVMNIEALEDKSFATFETIEKTIEESMNLMLAGTGWTIVYCDVTKKRTIRKDNRISSWELIKEAKKTYRCDIKFDSLRKEISIYNSLGSYKGAYAMEDINLRALQIQSNSYDFYTRLVPEGKDGLTIASVNGGKNYIESFQHSNKIKTLYWKDERYTNAQSLLEDSRLKLDELSKPLRAFSASIIKFNTPVELGDTIKLINKTHSVKELQRIVKIIEYPNESENNTVELANKSLSFEDMQQEIQEATSTINDVTTPGGSLDGTKVDGMSASQIKDLEQEVSKLTADKANIGDLNAVKASIGELEATKANITDLNAIKANISKLEADKANITDLEAINADIEVLEADTATIKNLVNGNLSSENIQTGGITGDRLNMKTIQVGNANIIDLDATKINTGELNTSRVIIASDDGGIRLAGNTQQFLDENGKVRIQLGKDQQGNFDFYILAENGDILFNTRGITGNAIENGLIKEDMLDDGSVTGNKIDWSSFETAFNDETNTTTLNSSKISLDGTNQTLDVAFNSIKSTVTEQGEQLEANTTQLSTQQGKIETLIQETNIIKNEDITSLNDKYSSINQKVDGIKTTVAEQETILNNHTGQIESTNTKVNAIEQEIDSISLSVSETNTKVDNIEIGGTNLYALKNVGSYVAGNVLSKPSQIIIDGNKISVISNPKDLVGNTIKNLSDTMIISGKTDLTSVTYYYKFSNETSQRNGTIPVKNGKFELIVKVPNGATSWNVGIGKYPYSIPYYLESVKFEKGNKATDWSPAPEDVSTEFDNKISTAKAEIQITTDSISQSISNLNTTINQKADGSTVNTLSNKVSSIETNLNSITSRVSSVESTTTTINGNIINLESRMSTAEQKITPTAIVNTIVSSDITKGGKMLYTDPTFKNGINGLNVYNNAGNGIVTLSRIAKTSDCPTSSGYVIEIKTKATGAAPGNGGFFFGNLARANAIFLYKFTAKIPEGLIINFATNALGSGASSEWITSNKGTGSYQDYIYKVVCGGSGTFSSTGFFYLSNGTPPITWYLASATVLDLSDVADVTGELSDSIKNGAVINTVSTVLDKNGLTINNGALTIKNNAGNAVLKGDVNGNLTVTGNITGSTISGSTITGSTISAINTLNVSGTGGSWGQLNLNNAWNKYGSIYSNDQRGLNLSSNSGILITTNNRSSMTMHPGGDTHFSGNIYIDGCFSTYSSGNNVRDFVIGDSSYMHVVCSDGARGINWWSSDLKIKKNIVPLNDYSKFMVRIPSKQIEHRKSYIVRNRAIDVINKIEHFSYYTTEGEKVSCGYIAQQLEEIDTEFIFKVSQTPKIINADGVEIDNPSYDANDPVIRNPKPSAIIPYMTKAIQEQQVIIEELQRQIEELRKKLA